MVSTFLAPLDRGLVVVSGPDATTFLQSLLSQDLDPIGVGEATHALLLEPKGKLVVDLRAARVGTDEWWCVCERGFGVVLEQGLKRFRIRVKVEIDDRSADLAAVALRGPDAVAMGATVLGASRPITGVRVDWPDVPGIELLGDRAAIDAAVTDLANAGAVETSAQAYEAMRIEAGVPRQGHDIDETTIAQEAFLERDAVSFTKGCFLGQELVCRIDTRGHVNRLLRRLRCDAPVARGAAVIVEEREVGIVTSAIDHVALAMIRRQIEPASEVLVRTPGGDVAARVEAAQLLES